MQVRTTSRVGDLLLLMGMVGRDESGAMIDGVVPQTRRALERIDEALQVYDRGLDALVRLRVYLTDIDDWPAVRDEVTRAVGDEWPPALAVEVGAFVDPAMKVELEADASVA